MAECRPCQPEIKIFRLSWGIRFSSSWWTRISLCEEEIQSYHQFANVTEMHLQFINICQIPSPVSNNNLLMTFSLSLARTKFTKDGQWSGFFSSGIDGPCPGERNKTERFIHSFSDRAKRTGSTPREPLSSGIFKWHNALFCAPECRMVGVKS